MMKKSFLLLMAMLGSLAISAAELKLDNTNAYNPFGNNRYDYMPRVNGVLTVSFPAEALTGKNLGYSFVGGVHNMSGNFFSDAAVVQFSELKAGTTYTLTLNSSFDISATTFSASFEADGTVGNESKPEQTFTVSISDAKWGFMDKSHLMLEARNAEYEVCLTLPIGATIEGSVDFEALKQTSPTVVALSAGARTYYNMVRSDNLQLVIRNDGAQLLLTGSVLAQGEGHLYQFDMQISGAYPEKQKKENDEAAKALTGVLFTQASVQYDDRLFAYVVSGLSQGWKYEGQVVLNLTKDGAMPAAGTYEVSDDVTRVEGMCQGGLAGMSDLGLGVAGSCFFLLNEGEKVLPGCWLLSSGTVTVEVQNGVLTLTTQAKNSYGLDVQVVMTTADTYLTAMQQPTAMKAPAKYLRDGRLFILRDGVAYDLLGR